MAGISQDIRLATLLVLSCRLYTVDVGDSQRYVSRELIMKFLVIILSMLLGSASVKADMFAKALEAAAMARTAENVTYDGSYMKIPYPNGDG